MSLNVYKRTTCRLCNGTNLVLALPLAPTPLADAYVSDTNITQEVFPLDLYLCQDCGFVQLLDIVSPEGIYVDYIYETVSSLGLVDHFRAYAQQVTDRYQLPAGSLVIDLGSNDGTLLRPFKEKGMRVLGVDPAREIAYKATESGIETLPIFFNVDTAREILEKYGQATIITCNNLFANVDDLDGMVEGIRSLLAPNGVFIFESFYLVDYIQNIVFDFAYHEHLSYFSVKPLLSFFKKHGMEIIDAERIPTKGGSLRYSVQLAGAGRKVEKSVAELVELETQIGTDRIETFQQFGAAIDRARTELLALLSGLKSKGKTVAGYGASATTTTFIYHFGLGEILSFIADDYPAKQNLFSPGHHIPILSSQVLYDKKPDYVVIIAWRYVDPIVKKNEQYRKQGGRFVIPLPSLSIT